MSRDGTLRTKTRIKDDIFGSKYTLISKICSSSYHYQGWKQLLISWSSRFILRGHKQEDVSKYDEYGSVTADAEFVGSKWEITNPELWRWSNTRPLRVYREAQQPKSARGIAVIMWNHDVGNFSQLTGETCQTFLRKRRSTYHQCKFSRHNHELPPVIFRSQTVIEKSETIPNGLPVQTIVLTPQRLEQTVRYGD